MDFLEFKTTDMNIIILKICFTKNKEKIILHGKTYVEFWKVFKILYGINWNIMIHMNAPKSNVLGI